MVATMAILDAWVFCTGLHLLAIVYRNLMDEEALSIGQSCW